MQGIVLGTGYCDTLPELTEAPVCTTSLPDPDIQETNIVTDLQKAIRPSAHNNNSSFLTAKTELKKKNNPFYRDLQVSLSDYGNDTMMNSVSQVMSTQNQTT